MKRVGWALGIVAVGVSATRAMASAPAGQYVVSTDTVADTKTGLTWQRNVPAASYTWANASPYCASLSLGGFASGWRMPTKRELESIVDRRVAAPGPTIDGTAFPSTPNTFFWTATKSATDPTQAWYVFFLSGTTGTDVVGFTYRVRCVH
jgi:hypothetical protein